MATWKGDDDYRQNYRGILGYFTVDTPRGPQLFASLQPPDMASGPSLPPNSLPENVQTSLFGGDASGIPRPIATDAMRPFLSDESYHDPQNSSFSNLGRSISLDGPQGRSNRSGLTGILQATQPNTWSFTEDNSPNNAHPRATLENEPFQVADWFRHLGRNIYVPRILKPLEDMPKGSSGGPNAGKDFTRVQRREFPDGEPCVYCGVPTKRLKYSDPDRLNSEHAIAQSKGGNNESGNHVPSCQTCNLEKYWRTAQEFWARRWEQLKNLTPEQVEAWYYGERVPHK